LDKPAGDGPPVERKVFDFKGPGVAMGMHNRDESLKGFRALVVQLRVEPRLAGLSVDQEHDPQSL
jgi:hypothetical protein